MKLTHTELAKVFEIVIAFFNNQGIREITFAAEDFYPRILREQLDFDNSNFLKCPRFGLDSLDFDFEVWKRILNDNEEAIYAISGEIIRKLGGILIAFGQVSDRLDNPNLIKNEGSPQKPPPTLSLHELGEIFKLVLEALKKWYNSVDMSFDEPRYIKIALRTEYLGMDCPPYTIGSLDDGIKGWKQILSGKSSPAAIDIEMLGELLTAFGEELDW